MESHINIENGLEIMNSFKEGYNNKMRSKLFGLLCEREKDNSEWERFLDSILIELMGYEEERRTINYYILYSKLASLRFLRFNYFRKTIFDCMNLIPEE